MWGKELFWPQIVIYKKLYIQKYEKQEGIKYGIFKELQIVQIAEWGGRRKEVREGEESSCFLWEKMREVRGFTLIKVARGSS